jgi:DNA-binding MarR family transcriptional regulator
VDDERAIRLRRIIVRLARQFNASSTGEGLTPSQSSVLGLIVGRGPLSLAELGDLEGLNPTMLSRVVSRLQAMNLITRVPDPSDMRKVSVTATPAGVLAFQHVQRRQAAAISRCLALLDEPDADAILASLPALEGLAGILQQADRELSFATGPGLG